MTTGRINQVVTKPTQTLIPSRYSSLVGRLNRIHQMDTINSIPKGIKYPMPSLQLWLRHKSNASRSRSCYASKFSPAKAEDWELHERHRVATNHSKPLFHSKQPYSLSNLQPSFPIPYRIPEDRKAWANAKSPKPALRLNWVEWRHKTEALARWAAQKRKEANPLSTGLI